MYRWKEFTKEMDKEGPFFLGSEPSLTDFVVAPWAVNLVPIYRKAAHLLSVKY